MDLVLWVRAWQLEQRKCCILCMDWSLDHYKLRGMSDVGKWRNLLRELIPRLAP